MINPDLYSFSRIELGVEIQIVPNDDLRSHKLYIQDDTGHIYRCDIDFGLTEEYNKSVVSDGYISDALRLIAIPVVKYDTNGKLLGYMTLNKDGSYSYEKRIQ